MNTGTKHAVAKPAGNLLASLTVEYMRNIKVVLINKPCMPVSAADAALVTLKRHLENADELAVHTEGKGKYPIFNRTDIVVNNEENIEERIELTSHDNTPTDRDNKRKRSRSRSVSSSSSGSSTGSREGRKRMPKYRKEHHKNILISPAEQTQRSYNQKEIYKIKRSVVDKREKAPKSARNQDREQNAKEKCSTGCRESYKENFKRTGHQIDSPGKSSYKHERPRKEKYTRSRSRSPKTRSKSPSNKKQGSPCYRKCSCSQPQDSQRRDQSPRFNQHRERQKRETGRGTRSSSHERDLDNSSRSRRDRTRERLNSCSPQSRRPSTSRKHSETRSKPRSSSSPNKFPNSFRYEDRRNKSPPKHVDQYTAPPYTFGYYGAEGLWMPGPQQRPNFMPRNFIPPPMPMVGGPTYFIPRPYMSAPHPLYHFRPRGIPYRHRMPVSRRSTTINAVRTSATRSPSVMEEPSSTSGLNDKDDST